MISIKHIRKSFGDKLVISDFSVDMDDGKKLIIMGPSGSGKTTLLRIIAGLETADSGEVSGVPEKKAFVFQEDRLAEDFSVQTNVSTKGNFDITHLEEVDLAGEEKTKVKKLSGGMKRRVALVRAMLRDAEIVFLDEPFKGLDPELKIKTMDYVKKYTSGKTVVMVTHDEAEAEYMEGKIVRI